MKTKRVLLLGLLTVFLANFSFAQTVIGRQKVDQYPTQSWGSPTYGLTWLPTDYATSGSQKYPLIIFLHGAGEVGDGVSGLNNLITTALPQKIAQGWDPEAVNPSSGQSYKFIVVSPQAPYSSHWSYNAGPVSYILADVMNRYRVDPSRIYVTGVSAGGAGTWSCVTNGVDFAKKFAAIVPVSAAGTNFGYEAAQLPMVGGTYGVKVWSVCGANDAWYAFSQTTTNTINTAVPAPSVPAVCSGVPGADHSAAAWNTAYNPSWRSNSLNLNIYEWLLQYTRPSNAPAASAGSNQAITLPANNVSLSGSGTAAVGNTIASYAWSQVSGPWSFAFTAASAAATQVTNLVQGTYVFRLTVTDNAGATGFADVTITVNPAPNVPPSVNGGADQTITLPLNFVTVAATASDPDGSIASYQWTKVAGPAASNIVSATSATTQINNLVKGVYQFEIKVTDNQGATATHTVKVTVNGYPNTLPIANAGADQTITLPTNTILLNGSGADVNGTIVTYAWAKIAGPASYSITSAATAQTTINNLVQGIYQFTLTVTDDSASTARDTVQITVNPAPNVAPTANAGPDQSLTLPTHFTNLNGSGADVDGTVVTYLWTKLSGPSSYDIGNATDAQTNLANLTQGTYRFELKVTDNLGATGRDTMVIVVNATPNQLPVVNAGVDQVITLPINSTTLAGIASDADGTITGYQWSKVSGPASFVISAPTSASTMVQTLTAGVYKFELRVTDNSGATAKDTVQVFVNAAPNIPPTASAGADQSITLPINAVTVTGSGADADGSIISYAWSRISGPALFTITNATQAATTITSLQQGVYKFELAVTDNSGSIARDTIQVTVHYYLNSLPVANAGADQVITLPLNTVTVTGTGSDVHGSIVSYVWSKITGPSGYQITQPTSAQTTISNLSQGVYEFQLKVTDDSSSTAVDTMRVTVNAAANILPAANAGADQTIILPLDSVHLTGSATDADGSIVSYSWTKISGPAQYLIQSPTSAQTNFISLTAGVYALEFKAMDNSGASARDTVVITVDTVVVIPPPNQAPVTQAGLDKTITLPTDSVVLNGSASDADGTIAAYSWRKISGPVNYSFIDSTVANVRIRNLQLGVYRFELTATDDAGATARDTVSVIVNAAPVVQCNGVRKYIIPGGTGGKYINGADPGSVWYMPVNPGDTLVLKSQYSWSYFSMENYSGTASCPIVVINEGGQVWLTAGIETKSCKYIKITGSGDANTYYGFKIYNPGNDGAGVALSIQGKARAIEAERLDVHKKTYGVWAKQDPLCDESFNYPNFRMDSIEIHHSRFRNIGQDCIYAGNTDPTGQRTLWCNGVAHQYIPMRISNVNIHHLIIDSCNRTGIQISGADQGYNQVHDNLITNCGYEYNQQQGTGISIGGMTKNCHVYNNVIRNTFLYGILSLGAGVNYIENNTIDSSGWLNGIANTVSAPVNIMAMPRNTIPFDSTTIIVRYNKLGRTATPDSVNIAVTAWGPPTWTVNNVICNNKKLANQQPALLTIAPTITYINDCSAALPKMPPTAYAGNNQVLPPPTDSTQVVGSGSDPDGTIKSYRWSKISGPSPFTIVSPDSATTTIRNLAQGIYTFRLTVWDNDSLAASDDIQISVAPPNELPIANAGADVVITLPVNSVNITGSGIDPDGTIISYQWSKIGGPACTIAAPTNAQTQINNLLEGVYFFELLVTDNSGAQDRDTLKVTVHPPAPVTNIPPVANAGSDQLLTLPTNSTTLTGIGSDADGSIVGYSWTKVSGPAGFALGSPTQSQTTLTSLVVGIYSFELAVTDNQGSIAKDTVVITVKPAPNVLPFVNAGPDQVITLPTNSVVLTGNAGDPDGVITSYSWTKISGPAGFSIVSPMQAQTSIQNLVAGTYQFELKVSDDAGDMASDTVTVVVNQAPPPPPPPNVLPVCNAGSDITITLPVNTVSLQGLATDQDGTISSYVWTKISGPIWYSIISPQLASTSVVNMIQGVYKFELKVIDNDGGIARDTVVVTVNPPVPPNVLPVASAGSDLAIRLPVDTVIVNGTGTDADGTVVSYRWSKILGPSSYTIVSPNQATTLIRDLVEGIYQFELKITDNNGGISRDTLQITVRPDIRIQSTVSLYPNPGVSDIFVRIDALTHRNQTYLKIYNEQGMIVYSEEFLRSQQVVTKKINVSKLPRGSYMIVIGADINKEVSLKFIKQ